MTESREEMLSSASILGFCFILGCLILGGLIFLASKNIDIDIIYNMGEHTLVERVK